MKFERVIPYKLRCALPILGLAGASLFTSCEGREPKLNHNTTYCWGNTTPNEWGECDKVWENITPEQIRASADSGLVDTVYLRKMEQYPLNGMDDWYVKFCVQSVIKKAYKDAPESPNIQKIRGKGTLDSLVIDNPADSLWLTNFGFVIKNAVKNY